MGRFLTSEIVLECFWMVTVNDIVNETAWNRFGMQFVFDVFLVYGGCLRSFARAGVFSFQ